MSDKQPKVWQTSGSWGRRQGPHHLNVDHWWLRPENWSSLKQMANSNRKRDWTWNRTCRKHALSTAAGSERDRRSDGAPGERAREGGRQPSVYRW